MTYISEGQTSTTTQAQRDISSGLTGQPRVLSSMGSAPTSNTAIIDRKNQLGLNTQIFNFSGNPNLSTFSPYYPSVGVLNVVQFHRYNPSGDRPIFSIQNIPEANHAISKQQIECWLGGKETLAYKHYLDHGASINLTVIEIVKDSDSTYKKQQFLYRPHYAQFPNLTDDKGKHIIKTKYGIFPFGQEISFGHTMQDYDNGSFHDQVASDASHIIAYKEGDGDLGFICVTIHSNIVKPVDISYISFLEEASADQLKTILKGSRHFSAFLEKAKTLSDKVLPFRSMKNLLNLSVFTAHIFSNTENKYFTKGFSDSEGTHRWSDGNASQIKVDISLNDIFAGKFVIDGFMLDKQSVQISLNGGSIFQGNLEGALMNKVFDFNPKLLQRGENHFDFKFPNAHQPGNGDPRTLALAIKSFSVE